MVSLWKFDASEMALISL